MGNRALQSEMIIVCGAGSALAKVAITDLAKTREILAISRAHVYDSANITNVNLSDYKEINYVLGQVDSTRITWVNFVAHSNDALVFDLSEDAVKEDYELNFFLNFRATRTLLPKMLASRYGRFIFISSSRALKGDTGIFSYRIGKLSSLALQEQIVKEYTRFGVTANTISLGFYDTPLWENIDEATKTKLLREVPTAKLSDSNSIAPAISLIIDHSTVNNNVIRLDDGYS